VEGPFDPDRDALIQNNAPIKFLAVAFSKPRSLALSDMA
jgi:hypothetical protein